MKIFTPTAFRANSSEVFNAVQEHGEVAIKSKNRPDMVIMMKNQFDALQGLVSAANAAVKDHEGDAHMQAELDELFDVFK